MNASIPVWMLIATFAFGTARAQEEPKPEAPPAAEQKQPAPDLDFKPSQEVSQDLEVDFQADI